MTSVLLDTHAWVWSVFEPDRLSPDAEAAIRSTPTIGVSPVSFYEIAQKVRVGKWSTLAVPVEQLPPAAVRQGARLVELTPEIGVEAGLADWDNRDPFDRLIAATARHHGLALISRDRTFSTFPGLTCIW